VIVVGCQINTSLGNVNDLVASRDSDGISRLAVLQRDLGADAIGVNAGTRIHTETQDMEWLTKTVQRAVSLPVWVDTANPEAMEAGLTVHDDSWGPPLVDSATAEPERLDAMAILTKRFNGILIGLMMDEEGIPATPEGRVNAGKRILEHSLSLGISKENLYLDPLVIPVSTGDEHTVILQDTVLLAKRELGVKISCAPDNVSMGLPIPGLVSQTLTVMCMAWGADLVALLLDERLATAVRASQMLLGRDEYCKQYIKGYRAGLYEWYGGQSRLS
jgi:cobalamin-dependent methionine synthase I